MAGTDEFAKLDGGSSSHKAKQGDWEIKVQNDAGAARSHIHLAGVFHGVRPEVLFAIFTYPDNSKLFRDVQRVGQRKVVTLEPNFKVVEVEQLGELKILWVQRTFSTWLKVTEDCRDTGCLSVQFDLMHSDLLSQFNGRWELRPLEVPGIPGISTASELHQDVLPKGVPPFMKNLPVMGNLLRGVALRAMRRIMEDVQAAVGKIQALTAKGATVEAALRQLCGAYEEEGHANGAVPSFAVSGSDAGSDDEHDVSDAGSDLPLPALHSLAIGDSKQQRGSQSPSSQSTSSVEGAQLQEPGVKGGKQGVAGATVPGAPLVTVQGA
ncbi:hypothetical protein V8C86DRAFT_2872269 [Haematococcus lacustris]